jgi:hypothetical protein
MTRWGIEEAKPGQLTPILPTAAFVLLNFALLLVPVFQILLSGRQLNPDTYFIYTISTGYMASIHNIANIGANTVGPVVPGTIAIIRLFIDPGANLHNVEIFARALAIEFITLTWAGSLLVLLAANRDWRVLTAFSAAFLTAIDWGSLDYRSLNGELFSAPFLIALLLCAPLANPRNLRGLAYLCASALLLALVFFIKVQAFPIACFVFVFADALRDAFTLRVAVWRAALVIGAFSILAVLPQLFSLHAQDVVTNALSYLHGSGYVAPADQMAKWAVVLFLPYTLIHGAGLVATLFFAIAAVWLLKRPAGRNIWLGLTQTEWFTLGLFLVSCFCIVLPFRFFNHYVLLLLPAFPLMFSIFVARCSILNVRWIQAAVAGLCAFIVVYQLTLITWAQRPGLLSQSSETIQSNAERIRAACPDAALPIITHGWDYRYYVALGSYPSIGLLDIAREAGFPPKLVKEYREELGKGSSLIIDIVDPASVLDHDFPKLDDLLGSDASKYRQIAIASRVTVYCPKSSA